MSASRVAPALSIGPGLGFLSGTLLSRVGRWSLGLLVLSLPFEVTQRPLVVTPLLTVTTLKVPFYLAVVLAVVTVAFHLRQTVAQAGSRQISLLLGLLLVACVSSLLSSHPANGLKWTLDMALGGTLWLAVPFWLEGRDDIEGIGRILLVGAVISALIGLAEVWVGPHFDSLLVWFKLKPAMAGPYLRLSATFEYTNIAAGYFAVVLPFAATVLTPRAGKWRWVGRAVAAAAVSILLAALLLTYSRGALLGLGAGAISMVLATRHLSSPWALVRRGWWLNLSILVAGLVAAVLAGPGNPALLRLTTENDQAWYLATYHSQVPVSLPVNRVVSLPVTVGNASPISWQSSHINPYYLSYHWLASSGRVAVFDGLRTPLRRAIAPGAAISVRARVLTPATPGRYQLVWDMVLEHVTWFSMKTGRHQSIPIRITGHAAATVPSLVAAAPPALSSAPPQPGRGELWPAALRMIRAHPLLGVGPDGYRLAYGRYTVPPRRTWDTRIFANSLPLELGADLGLIGLVLFAAFVLAVIWPLARAVVAGRVSSLAALVVAGALSVLLGHGLLDYLLGAHAMAILFWILLGMAGIARPSVVKG